MSITQTTSKAASITPGGGIESFTWRERQILEPGPGEVRVRMRAVSLNYRDLLIAHGIYPLSHQHPIVPVSDGAGIVDATGAGVTRLQHGQRVVANFMRDWVSGAIQPHHRASALGGEIDGLLAEYAILPEQALAVIPESLTFAEAAALPCAGVTAWNALCVTGRIQPGDTVLVQGSGGVAVFALQIANAAGARVIATSSSDEKLAKLRELGAAVTLNYRTTPDWANAVLEQTYGKGVDHVIEIGGPESLGQSLESVKPGGTVSVIGVLTGIDAHLSLAPILFKHVNVNGIFVGSRQMLEDLMRAGVRPVIDRAFPFSQAEAAYRYLESAAHIGKIVLEA